MIVLNVSQIVIYCNLTGSPYKSYELYQKVRKIGIVCAVWGVAFVIKFTASFFGDELYDLNVNKDDDFWQAAYLAVFTLITEIVPVFAVIDGSFVKIFSAEHLETTIDEEVTFIASHLSKDTVVNETLVSDAKDSTVSSGVFLMASNSRLAVTDQTNQTQKNSFDISLVKKTLCEASAILEDKNSIPLTVGNKSALDLYDQQKEKLQTVISTKLTIAKKKDFEKLDPLVKDWYPNDEKVRKTKLGSLYECRMPN